MFAPSPYTRPPQFWISPTTSSICSSNMPSVLGLVIINPTTVSSQAALSDFRSTFPRSSEGISSTSNPLIVVLAGLVPCALSGMRILVRFVSPRSRW